MIGIYRIKNLVNKKCYIGSSVDISTRWVKHKALLYKRYKVISLEAPIIYNGKPFELLGYREDLITKTSEEILNGTV